MIHNYRWRLGLADGEPDYDELEDRLAQGPVIGVPTITMEGDANGAPHPDADGVSREVHRHLRAPVIAGGVGHNLPQEAPRGVRGCHHRRGRLLTRSEHGFTQEVTRWQRTQPVVRAWVARPRYRPRPAVRPDPLDRPSPGGASSRHCRSRAASPSFAGATGWLNADPLTPEGLRGRVVLVDFWTYTCINWLRTLPYVRAWAAKYADAGLTVVGVHTPEFGFERDLDNVTTAFAQPRRRVPRRGRQRLRRLARLRQPLLAGDLPRRREGRIRYHHFGEGEYAMTEMVIQQLLLDAGAQTSTRIWSMVDRRVSRSPRTGARCGRPRRTSGTARAAASPRRTPPIHVRTRTPRPAGSRSTTGRSPATWTVPGTLPC